MNLFTTLYELIDDRDLWQDELVLKRNAYLCMPGAYEHHLYYVVSGTLKIFIVDDYVEQIIRFGYQDNFITALDSYLSTQPTDFYIQAIKKTTLRSVRKSDVQALLLQNQQHASLWVQILEAFVLQQIEREKDILISSPQERYKRVLDRSPRLFQEVPLKYIASYLRMTPETLSRIRNS